MKIGGSLRFIKVRWLPGRSFPMKSRWTWHKCSRAASSSLRTLILLITKLCNDPAKDIRRGGVGLHWQWFFQKCPVFRNTSCLPSPQAKHVCQAAQQKINEEVSRHTSLPSSGLYYNTHTSGGQGNVASTWMSSFMNSSTHTEWIYWSAFDV